jgi:hypothetical protein
MGKQHGQHPTLSDNIQHGIVATVGGCSIRSPSTPDHRETYIISHVHLGDRLEPTNLNFILRHDGLCDALFASPPHSIKLRAEFNSSAQRPHDHGNLAAAIGPHRLFMLIERGQVQQISLQSLENAISDKDYIDLPISVATPPAATQATPALPRFELSQLHMPRHMRNIGRLKLVQEHEYEQAAKNLWLAVQPMRTLPAVSKALERLYDIPVAHDIAPVYKNIPLMTENMPIALTNRASHKPTHFGDISRMICIIPTRAFVLLSGGKPVGQKLYLEQHTGVKTKSGPARLYTLATI